MIASGPVRRALGVAELFFQTLSAGKEGGGQQSVAPFARDEEVERVLGEGRRLGRPDLASLERVSSRHVVRAAIREVAIPLLLILGLAAFHWQALLLLPVLPLLLAGAFVRRRVHRYALSGGTLYVRDGLWRQRLWIVPARNAEALRLTRSFLQRRLGLATLAVDTAGAPTFGGPRIVDLRLETARALMNDLAANVRG
jgi:putative membrane protein